jgi:hypothetical protein
LNLGYWLHSTPALIGGGLRTETPCTCIEAAKSGQVHIDGSETASGSYDGHFLTTAATARSSQRLPRVFQDSWGGNGELSSGV